MSVSHGSSGRFWYLPIVSIRGAVRSPSLQPLRGWRGRVPCSRRTSARVTFQPFEALVADGSSFLRIQLFTGQFADTHSLFERKAITGEGEVSPRLGSAPRGFPAPTGAVRWGRSLPVLSSRFTCVRTQEAHTPPGAPARAFPGAVCQSPSAAVTRYRP